MAKVNINSKNWKKFTKSALLPNAKKTESDADRKVITANVRLLEECEMMYNSLQDFRNNREENVNYYFGDQLSRMIPDPDGCGMISIERYAIKQGMTPLKMNLITSRIRQMVGVYEKQKLEDLTIARDHDEQKLGEMMSVAMQYAYQHNNLYRANADGYREFLISALPCYRTGFDFDSNRKISDVYADLEDINRMFWDNNTSGLYFANVTKIGKLHEFTMLELLAKFAKTPSLRKQIIEAYGQVHKAYPTMQQFSRDISQRKFSFYTPMDNNKERVIEVWSKEEHEVYVCYDPLESEPQYTIDVAGLDDILMENERRRREIASFGGDPNDAATIDYEYRVDSEWVVRFLTPCGHILYQAVSPYLHGSHPWAIGGYPMVDGRVQSLVNDLKPAQDMVNRLVMRMEFVRMNQAKGFAIVEKAALEDSDMTEEDFAKLYTSPKGVAALYANKFGGVQQIFARFTDEGGVNSDMGMLQSYIEMINQQSGSTDAARGEQGGSHESASRYMMETENSNNNTCDGEQWFNGLILVRDTKIMQLMQQYYEGTRYLNIAGNKYTEESKWYDADKVRQTQFDLSIIQQPSNGVVRMMMNDTINTLLQYGAIDGNTAIEALQGFGMDDILRIKQKNEQAMMEQQQAIAQQQAMQQQAQQSQQ